MTDFAAPSHAVLYVAFGTPLNDPAAHHEVDFDSVVDSKSQRHSLKCDHIAVGWLRAFQGYPVEDRIFKLAWQQLQARCLALTASC